MIVPVQVRWPRLRRAEQGTCRLPDGPAPPSEEVTGGGRGYSFEAVVAGGELGVVVRSASNHRPRRAAPRAALLRRCRRRA